MAMMFRSSMMINSILVVVKYCMYGVQPKHTIRFILTGRRLTYYWCLLNKSDVELAKKVLEIQKQHRCKDDWINEIEENLDFCDITLNEE